jgi:protein O-GlcNAc transferase
MKKIISYSLWGDNPTYTVGAIKNADLALEIYPGWICRYYVGKSTPTEIISSLVDRENTEVFVMNDPGNWTGMFWRFYPASEPDVAVMLSRDTDSRLSLRERAAVDDWLDGDKDFHIMRDHPYHATEILGGMWGVRNGFLLGMRQAINDYNKGDFWQVDQNFLKKVVYPYIINNVCVHDEFFQKSPFPTLRTPKHFVGQAFDADDNFLHPEHGDLL